MLGVRKVAALGALAGLAALVAAAVGSTSSPAAAAATGCQLGSGIKHVIYLQFDNTHFRRDVSNVPSDLEQMPHLLNFLTSNGTLFTDDHTILISHTAGGITSSLTGLYPDRMGLTVTNSYGVFRPDGTVGFPAAFKYWTDIVDSGTATEPDDPLPNMITDGQKNTPAPWVPYTRAGCDFGGVGTANIELENANTSPTGDLARVFGPTSPEFAEAGTNSAKAQTDFVGIAIHCSQATDSKCAGNANARPDLLPDEPGGYGGFQALFGAKYVDPSITRGSACVTNTAGEAISDPAGNCGFPGFDGMLAKNTLGYVAQMQESGVPVTFAYISDAHDIHVPDPVADTFRSHADGPGEADFKAQLKAYDDAFAAFFSGLAAHGIDRSNTLFVVTVDEGDHFAGGLGTPQSDGSLAYSHTNCTDMTACPSNQIGEVNLDLRQALGRNDFSVHSDDAPTFYVNGNPSRTDPSVRSLEHALTNLTEPDPYVNGGQKVPVVVNLADPVEEQTLHMVNTDPLRTPTFTMFGNDDIFFTASGFTPSCGANPCVSPGFAWNHGDIQDEIGNTWVGFVGPGVQSRGVDSSTWTDHTNVRPTILTLLGLKDDYTQDGRVLVEALSSSATPPALRANAPTVRALGTLYEQLNAPFGDFANATLSASTKAIESGSATDDSKYTRIENRIADLTAQRNAVASQIHSMLYDAAFNGKPVNPLQAIAPLVRGGALILQARLLAATS
jgi:hypothetical protein